MRVQLRLAVVVLAMVSVASPATAAGAPAEPLGHAGRWITDAEGRVVVLHGFNVVPFNEAVLPVDMGMGPDNAQWLADHGFNTVRLGLYYTRIEPQPGAFDDDYLADYLRVQKELAAEGIFTMLDFHQDQLHPRYGTGGPIPSRGFPAWFLKEDGLPNTATPYPQGYLTNPALNRAYDNIWQDFPASDQVSVQRHFELGWQHVAQQFRDKPGLLGYDIFNEPWPGSAAATCANPSGCPVGGFDQTLLTAFNRRTVAALRATDPQHLIFYEPNLLFDFGAATAVGDPGDANAGFTFHDYCLSATVPGLPSPSECRIGEEMVLDNAEAQSDRTGDALLLSEFGFDLEAATRMTRLMDEHMMSWQFWDYYGDYGSLHVAASPALIRPYPQLVSGTPEGWSLDEQTGTFDLVYSTARATGEGAVESAPAVFPSSSRTEIFVPEEDFPAGYGVKAAGAEVVSNPGAQLLELRSCPAAETIRVQVVRGARPTPSCAEPAPTACQFRTTGTNGPDHLDGSSFGDRLLGRRGADRLRGRGGDDCLRGGRGRDRLSGGKGEDKLNGGRARDLLRAADGEPDAVNCGRGRDTARVDGVDVVRRCEKTREG